MLQRYLGIMGAVAGSNPSAAKIFQLERNGEQVEQTTFFRSELVFEQLKQNVTASN